MRTNFLQNKSVKLNELSADQQTIVTAERRVNAAKRRLEGTERELQRLHDAEIFGKPASPAEIRRIEAQLREDRELISKVEAELSDARQAPARREKEEAEATTNIREMRALASEIDSWAEAGSKLLTRADAMIANVVSVGMNTKSGYGTLQPAYRGIEVLLDKLRHFLGPNGADRIAEYRKIGVVSAPKPAQPKPAQPLGIYIRSVPISRQARENAAVRSRMSPTGVVTTSEPRS